MCVIYITHTHTRLSPSRRFPPLEHSWGTIVVGTFVWSSSFVVSLAALKKLVIVTWQGGGGS